jgi:hypothetical protein
LAAKQVRKPLRVLTPNGRIRQSEAAAIAARNPHDERMQSTRVGRPWPGDETHAGGPSRGVHHRACHRGDLLIESGDSGGLAFWHADRTAYGGRPSRDEVDGGRRRFEACALGFGEGEARQAVHATRADVGCDGAVESDTQKIKRLRAKSRSPQTPTNN